MTNKVDIKRLDSVTKNDTTATEQINDNFLALQAAIENTLSRDGTGPNFMDADLDMNSYRIINSSDPVEDNDIVNLKYVEERIGGAVEASKTAVSAATQAANSAQSALVSSTNAINTLRNAENTINQATELLTDTQEYVDAAKADIDATVLAGKQEINTTIDEAQMSLSDTITQAVDDVKAEAVAAAEGAIQDAANTAIQIATDHTNTVIKPELQTYVDSSNANATIASNSADAAMEYANSASTSATKSETAALRAEEAAQQPGRVIQLGFDGAMQDGVLVFTHAPSGVEVPYTLLDEHEYELDLSYTGADLSSLTEMYVKNGSDTIRFVSAEHRSSTDNARVADMDAVMRYNSDTGYRWLFKAAYKVTTSGDKVFLLYPVIAKEDTSKITNCITEIPQDIKLELIDGVLTLKAGSKVYVPNGFEADGVTPKFDEVVIESDLAHTLTSAGQWKVVFTNGDTAWGTGPRIDNYNTNIYSGNTAPSVSSRSNLWYDTANNVMKTSYDNGASWVVSNCALPIGLITATTSGVSSIDQVFNGFGYVGSTVFALPNVKGLIPDGRNADGSLKNTEFTIGRVLTYTRGTAGTNYPLVLRNQDFINAAQAVYDEEGNYVRNSDGAINPRAIVGVWSADSTGRITSFTPKLPFHAADDQEVVKTSGDQTIDDVKTFTSAPISVASQPSYYLQMSDYDNTTTSTATKAGALSILDKNGNMPGRVGFWTGSDGTKSMRFITFDGQGNNTQLHIGFKSNGSVYTTCPTPESTSNTNAIATTAWVRNYVKNTGGGANWASKVSVARDTNYTAPSNGYIASLMQFDDTSGTLTINNAQIFTASGNVQSPSFTFVPVSKGDVVKLSGGAWVTAYFVPFK